MKRRLTFSELSATLQGLVEDLEGGRLLSDGDLLESITSEWSGIKDLECRTYLALINFRFADRVESRWISSYELLTDVCSSPSDKKWSLEDADLRLVLAVAAHKCGHSLEARRLVQEVEGGRFARILSRKLELLKSDLQMA